MNLTTPKFEPAAVFNFWQQFKEFAFKGSLIDLALGVIIGASFGKVVDALVKAIIMPTISYVMPEDAGFKTWVIGRLEVGTFLAELLNFLIVGFTLFVVIKKILRAQASTTAPPSEGPVTRECPYCISDIPIRATRCSHCTSELEPAVVVA